MVTVHLTSVQGTHPQTLPYKPNSQSRVIYTSLPIPFNLERNSFELGFLFSFVSLWTLRGLYSTNSWVQVYMCPFRILNSRNPPFLNWRICMWWIFQRATWRRKRERGTRKWVGTIRKCVDSTWCAFALTISSSTRAVISVRFDSITIHSISILCSVMSIQLHCHCYFTC